METVDVFIPVYNAGAFLPAAIDSVLSQTYTHWELLIIDDASTDNSWEIARRYAQKYPRIRVIRNDSNLGMVQNWNLGVSLCRAPFFVKLDADDVWHPRMLERAMDVLRRHAKVGMVFTRYINIDGEGNAVPGSDAPLPLFARDRPVSCIPLVREGPDRFLAYPILRQGLSVMRRSVFDRVGPYRLLLSPETQAAADTEFYFRAGAHFDIYFINEVLYEYRVHPGSISATDKRELLPDRKLYEIKWCILDYYISQGLVNRKAGKGWQKKVALRYAFHRAAYLRNNGRVGAAVKLLCRCMLQAPLSVLSFYTNRILQKMSAYE